MKQIVILSGKGGTGKTSLAAALAHLAHEGPCAVPLVLADADVDAANLDLVLEPKRLEEHEFIGGSVAEIDGPACTGCGLCADACRFQAIRPQHGRFEVDSMACEGCAACIHQCPPQAIRMQPQVVGHWYLSESRYGPLLHAALFPAGENSGKLVTVVRQQARREALIRGTAGILVDGPPGIGCPVIAAAAGADLALVVTEPSLAGRHDLERILKTTRHFGVPTWVILNKADLVPEARDPILETCREQGTEIVGEIPFDVAVTEAMVQGEPVTAFARQASSSQAILEIWRRLAASLFEESVEAMAERTDHRGQA